MSALSNRIRPFFQVHKGLFKQYGWWNAWRAGRPVDAKGDPLPWITYPAIDFLSQFDFSDASVFEWGSGYSTLWWAPRCRQIASVESNKSWISYIKGKLPAKVDLLETEFTLEAEVQALETYPSPSLDVIVIDNNGPFRPGCAKAAAARIAPGGFIIIDNSDQCLVACKILRDEGFVQIDFTGFVPGTGYAQCTSFFFKGAYKFRTRDDQQPVRSVAQPNAPWADC